MWDVLVGGDIVYDGTVVPLHFAMVSRNLSLRASHSVFLCSRVVSACNQAIDIDCELVIEP
jgi:hypothetical protein